MDHIKELFLDIDDNDHYAFIHFTDQNAYGRIVCLEPVEWHNDWPICGLCKDPLFRWLTCIKS
ncbi:MAG: hypothetical protein L6U99_01350 [Clostridium sp.]|nr:MAG: hypothetical protein L6U99_01350 [Clostridium sp.]